MRLFFIVFGLFVSAVAQAAPQPVSINMNGVSLVSFAQSTYKNLLGRDFVITPDALALDRKMSISLRSLDVEQLPAFVEGVLSDQGISSELRDGVYYLRSMQSVARSIPNSSMGNSAQQPGPLPLAMPAQVISLPFLPASGVPAVGGEYRSATGSLLQSGLPPGADVEAYLPLARPVEFLARVVVAAFGPNSAVVAGNQIVLAGTEAQLVKMRAIVRSLDQLPHMVDVSASWVEVAETGGQQQGISVMASVLGAKLGGSLGWIGSNAVSLKSTSFSLVIDALTTDGRFRQVSNSRIVGDDYEKMSLNVGDETPTIGSTSSDNSGNAIQNVVYRPSGVIVDVLPKVLGGGKVSLSIDGQISSFKATLNGVTGSPTLTKRQVKTSVTVGDGEVLLIGGLSDAQNDDRAAGLSFLPSSWSLKNRSRSNTDLVLILTASVVKSAEKP